MKESLRNNWANIVVGAIIGIVAVVSCAFFISNTLVDGGYEAIVHDSEGAEHVLDMSQDGTYSFETDLGRNTVVVQGGKVSISEADCPNGDCMRQRPISKPGEQIICLPHRFWIEVVAEGEHGSSMNVDAVGSDEVDVVSR